MPVLVGSQGLLKALPFERGFAVVWSDQSGIAEHAVDAGGADRDNISVEHHEGKPTVAFQGMPGVEVEDGFFLPVLQPPIAGDQRVVLVGQAVASPVVELARGDSQPCDEPLDRNLGAAGPLANVIDDRVANVVGDPGAGQSSPSSFLTGYGLPSIRRRPRSCAATCRAAPRSSAGATAPATRSYARKWPHRSRRRASATRRRSTAAVGTCRKGRRSARGRSNGAGGWRPSQRGCSSCGAFASEKLLPSIL